MDYLAELDRRIADWWETAKSVRETFTAMPTGPKRPQHIDQLDARAFLRGLDADPPVFRIEDGYKLFSPLLPRLGGGSEKQWNLIERNKTPFASIRDETIVHYGVATELILDYGWGPDQIVSEPRTDGRLSRGSVDLLLYRDASPVVAVEAKGAPDKVAALVCGIDNCEGEPGRGHMPTDHKKCHGLLYFRPDFFWVVGAAQTRQMYEVSYGQVFVRLTPTDESILDVR